MSFPVSEVLILQPEEYRASVYRLRLIISLQLQARHAYSLIGGVSCITDNRISKLSKTTTECEDQRFESTF